MDLDDGSLAHERHREDEARHAVFAEQFPAHARERPAHDLDVHALFQEGMRIVFELRRDELLDGVELVLHDRLRPALDGHQVCHAEDVEHPQALDEGKSREAISGKEGQLDLLLAVLPLAPRLAQRQERVDVS